MRARAQAGTQGPALALGWGSQATALSWALLATVIPTQGGSSGTRRTRRVSLSPAEGTRARTTSPFGAQNSALACQCPAQLGTAGYRQSSGSNSLHVSCFWLSFPLSLPMPGHRTHTSLSSLNTSITQELHRNAAFRATADKQCVSSVVLNSTSYV